ncbi:MAG TPA: class I adenylate-forming enzyme family protein [Candidatus Dormibacteraeota bacterium]|nr:class I adenylate-forming enzyme family protein [Candidatus Dormibacteraeota bacterium]
MIARDLVPAVLRAEWAREGHYPDRDLFGLFDEQACAHPEREAVVDDTSRVTYAELGSASRRLANQLADAGIRPGEVVAVQLPNSWQACAAQLAVAATGAVCLTYPMTAWERESEELLGRSGAVAAIVPGHWAERDYVGMVEGLRRRLPALRRPFAMGAERRGAVRLEPESGEDRWRRRRIDANGPACILVSSGTEALPKLVLYSHNGMAGGRGNFLGAFGVEEMRCWVLVPLASGLGSNGVCSVLARHGRTLVLSGSFSPDRTAMGLGERRPTHLLGVPAMLRLLLASPRLPEADISSLRMVLLGGASAPETLIREVEERLGCPCILGYGSADGVNVHPQLDDPPDKRYRTVGRPSPGLSSVRIVDPFGGDVEPGQVGEIWARGPISPLSYCNSPELDARYRTEDGWLKTGDVGYLDGEGYLVVAGRIKDVIIRGGQTISSAQVEDRIQGYPGVLLAACVGMPDEVLGERVCAFVAMREGAEAPELEELRRHLLDGGLDRHCLPERLEVVSEMPMNASGKIVKRHLLARLGVPVASEARG